MVEPSLCVWLEVDVFPASRKKREEEDPSQEVGPQGEDGGIQEANHQVLTDLEEAYTEEIDILKMMQKEIQMIRTHKKKWKGKEKC